ncbi:MAG: sigma-70 family RNA polymerase sigma factor [Acidobacteriota bacterium]
MKDLAPSLAEVRERWLAETAGELEKDLRRGVGAEDAKSIHRSVMECLAAEWGGVIEEVVNRLGLPAGGPQLAALLSSPSTDDLISARLRGRVPELIREICSAPFPGDTEVDRRWRLVCLTRSHPAFADWMSLVELPLRRALSRWSRAVDVEVVVQETLLRMWIRAVDGPPLEGRAVSLRFAHKVARNVAHEEARRARTGRLVPLDVEDDPPELSVDPQPGSDHGLRRVIRKCIEALPRRPREALRARLKLGAVTPDRDIASGLRMKPNTFLQNIVRARRFLEDCLARNGVNLKEVLR